MPEKDGRQAKQEAEKATSPILDLGSMLNDMEVSFLKRLKTARDQLDTGLPKVSSLNREQRLDLALAAATAKMMLVQRAGVYRSISRNANVSVPEKGIAALDSLALGLSADPLKVPADKQKGFESEFTKAWGTAKMALNEVLETPQARNLLNQHTSRRR